MFRWMLARLLRPFGATGEAAPDVAVNRVVFTLAARRRAAFGGPAVRRAVFDGAACRRKEF